MPYDDPNNPFNVVVPLDQKHGSDAPWVFGSQPAVGDAQSTCDAFNAMMEASGSKLRRIISNDGFVLTVAI